jgi:hypothetical protein
MDDETEIDHSSSLNCPISHHTHPEHPGGNVAAFFLESGYVLDHIDTLDNGDWLCCWVDRCEGDRESNEKEKHNYPGR